MELNEEALALEFKEKAAIEQHRRELAWARRINTPYADFDWTTFKDVRIPMPGVCMSHLDTEPCSTCWTPA